MGKNRKKKNKEEEEEERESTKEWIDQTVKGAVDDMLRMSDYKVMNARARRTGNPLDERIAVQGFLYAGPAIVRNILEGEKRYRDIRKCLKKTKHTLSKSHKEKRLLDYMDKNLSTVMMDWRKDMRQKRN